LSDPVKDNYLTPAKHAEHEIKIKGSRFIGLVYRVQNAAEAEAYLDSIRKKEHAATHHCYAWVAGLDKEEFRYSDDGEPNGTAGLPIYRVITGRNLKNTLVIVVRYYGGTKLGTGGLTRAYSQATGEVLDLAGTVEKLICRRLKFIVPFPLYDRVMRIISTGNYKIIDQQFADDVSLEIEIRLSHIKAFKNQIIELSGGQIDITEND